MARNAVNTKTQNKPASESHLLNWLGSALTFNLETKIGNEFPVRYLDRTLFMLILGVALIAFRLNAERQVRMIKKMTLENDKLKAAHTILLAHYMKNGKQSEIAPLVVKFGIEESKKPPYKLVIKEIKK
jgi:Bacteriodetes cell division protein (FtsL-like)